jgi:hypothetical protein
VQACTKGVCEQLAAWFGCDSSPVTAAFPAQGVSNVAWALATAGHQDEALFKKLLAHCMADIGAYDVQVRLSLFAFTGGGGIRGLRVG